MRDVLRMFSNPDVDINGSDFLGLIVVSRVNSDNFDGSRRCSRVCSLILEKIYIIFNFNNFSGERRYMLQVHTWQKRSEHGQPPRGQVDGTFGWPFWRLKTELIKFAQWEIYCKQCRKDSNWCLIQTVSRKVALQRICNFDKKLNRCRIFCLVRTVPHRTSAARKIRNPAIVYCVFVSLTVKPVGTLVNKKVQYTIGNTSLTIQST